jgi:hypothetical protein
MPIPALDENGLLPEGIHECTYTEIEVAFGQSQWKPELPSSTRRTVLCEERCRLCSRLRDYLTALEHAELEVEVLVDGSFVTNKPDPQDIDLIIVLPTGWDFSREPTFREESLLTGKRVRTIGYPFDLKVVPAGGATYREAVAFFQRVRDRDDLLKGMLRVKRHDHQ